MPYRIQFSHMLDMNNILFTTVEFDKEMEVHVVFVSS